MPHSRAICAVLQAAESAGVGTLCVLKLVAPQQMERIAFLVALLAFEGFGARVPQEVDIEIAGVFELPAAVLADAGLGVRSVSVNNALGLLVVDDLHVD